jgi:hypothetical protein
MAPSRINTSLSQCDRANVLFVFIAVPQHFMGAKNVRACGFLVVGRF